MAPRPYRVAREVARLLGCDDPFVLLLTPHERNRMTAQAMIAERPFAIRLVGPVAGSLDDGALANLMGHELGHWMAHGPAANPPSLVHEAWGRGASHYVARVCTLAGELTADRFGLLGSRGDLAAAVRLEVAMVTSDCPRALGLQELDFLHAMCERVERGDDVLINQAYPTTAFRLYAAWLFWRSDIHQSLTGAGPGDIAIRDVDAKLLATLLTRMPEPAERSTAGRPHGGQPFDARDARVPLTKPIQPQSRATNGTQVRDAGGEARVAAPAGTSRDEPGGDLWSFASSTASKVGRFLEGLDSVSEAVTSPPANERAMHANDDLDDLERRFRALEAKAAAAPKPKSASIDDLEARFRALEERERSG